MQQFIAPLALAALVLAILLMLQLRRALHDSAYHCLTRAGLERISRPGSDVLYLDIDHMHQLNDDYGHEAINARIARALAATTRRGEVVAGRWFSGDELVLLCPAGVGAHVVERLADALAAEGMSATMAVTANAGALLPAVEAAQAQVDAMKRARKLALQVGGVACR